MVGLTDVYRFLYAVIYVLTKYLVRRFLGRLTLTILTLRGESYFLQIGWKIIRRKSLLTQVDIYRDSQVGNIYILSFQY